MERTGQGQRGQKYPALESGAFSARGRENDALFQSRQEDTDVENIFFALG